MEGAQEPPSHRNLLLSPSCHRRRLGVQNKSSALACSGCVYYKLSSEAVTPQAESVGEPQLPIPRRASPGGVPRAGDDLVVIQEAAA